MLFVVMLSDSYCNIIGKIDQEAYGKVEVGSQDGYHLSTKEYDSISEMYYFCQRWYEPEIGKFISKAKSPLYDEHPYVYCQNNPISYTDLTGLKIDKECFKDCMKTCMKGVKPCGALCLACKVFPVLCPACNACKAAQNARKAACAGMCAKNCNGPKPNPERCETMTSYSQCINCCDQESSSNRDYATCVCNYCQDKF